MTLWECLGVKPDCTDEELRTAYRKKCLELHPDKTGNDPKKTVTFITMKEVYEKVVKRREQAKQQGVRQNGQGIYRFYTDTWTNSGTAEVHIYNNIIFGEALEAYYKALGLKPRDIKPMKPDYKAMADDADKKKKGKKK